jgi:malonate-semialdehyde dehydrogenase (acetylating) / methylmalonate-semialdehyde dehydrogenase
VRTIQHWVDGAETKGSSTRSAAVFDPATGEQQAEVMLAESGDVDRAVAAAAAAFEEWGDISISRRTRVLFAFREIVNRRQDELAAAITSEHGKVLSDARGEV